LKNHAERSDENKKEHGVKYIELGPDLQKKIRKVYPMVLSEAWSGS
jgi:hypothetical protein